MVPETHVKDVLTAEEVRNTDPVYTLIADVRSWTMLSWYVDNGLDQNVSCQIQYSENKSDWHDHGDTATTVNTVTKGKVAPSDITTVLYKYLRLKITAASNPSSGDLDVEETLKRF